VLFLISFTRTT